MNRDKFCCLHWSYYLVLEKDFLDVERYISFDFGDNYLYDSDHTVADYANSTTFSNEFVKQYQAICSEVDVILKTICKELGNTSADSMPDYTNLVLNQWSNLPNQKVRMNAIELQPFKNWSSNPTFKSPDWWSPYNRVKHERIDNFRNANLKNVANALAGLYILELYLVKFIGNRDRDLDVPNDISRLFELIDFQTNNTVVGHESYLVTSQDITTLFEAYSNE